MTDPLDTLENPKVKIEEKYQPDPQEIDYVGDVYSDYYRWRTYRAGAFRQFQGRSLEDILKISRELFWNATSNMSEDLSNIGLEFNIPFARKEVMDFVGRMVSLGVKPRLNGDELDAYGIKVLNVIYQRWRFKSNDKVEKFWQLLYGVVNGTVCLYVGYNDQKKTESFLKSFNPKEGTYTLETKDRKPWNDVEVKLVPIEDIYLSKIYERNIQKQGKLIWRTQMEPADFHREFQMYPDNVYVQPGNRIAEDSLYYRLLGGTGVTTLDKIEVVRCYDTDNDKFGIIANGIHLNKLGKGQSYKVAPMPFDHKLMPFVWAISEATDEKLAYGLPMPFKIKDLVKMSNAQYIMLMEHALRIVDKPFLSSDIESPEIIFGQKKVIPVTDVDAYKEIDIEPLGNEYMTTINSVQQMMSSLAQGGVNQVIPSIQPKSAAEVDSVNQAKQLAMGTPILMYYDMVRQEVLLCLKTMLQFYTAQKFQKDGDRIVKSLMVPNMPLSLGGTGDMEIRFVNKTKDPMELYLESVKKAVLNGKMTEILEAPIDLIQNLEFEITDIELEPENTSEMKKAMFVNSVIQPMIQTYIPMGLADPSKVMLRHLEALGEHPADYVSSKTLPQMMNSWGNSYPVPNLVPKEEATPQQQPEAPAEGSLLANMQQANTGQAVGGASNGGRGASPMTSPQTQTAFSK